MLILAVIFPLIVGRFVSSQLSSEGRFAILVSDPAAEGNQMNISMFKMFPVNLNKMSKEDSMKQVVNCKFYTQNSYKNTDPIVIYVDLDDVRCDIEESMIKNKADMLLLLENWNNRPSSPFPNMAASKYHRDEKYSIQEMKSWRTIPVFSLRQADTEAFKIASKETTTKMRSAPINKLQSLLEADSDLFSVKCYGDKTDPQLTRSCANDIAHGSFLGFQSLVRRNIEVTLSCQDQRKTCQELMKRKRMNRKPMTECEKTVTPRAFVKESLALQCKWNNTEENLNPAIGRKMEDLTIFQDRRCCSKNLTNLFFREGCREEDGATKDHPCTESWGPWSSWTGTHLLQPPSRKAVHHRHRLCYRTPNCSYLNTEYAVEGNSSDRPSVTKKQFFNESECEMHNNGNQFCKKFAYV